MSSANKKEQNQANYLANRDERKRKARERSRLRRQREKEQREKAKAAQMLGFDDFYDARNKRSEIFESKVLCESETSGLFCTANSKQAEIFEETTLPCGKSNLNTPQENDMTKSSDDKPVSKFKPLKLVSAEQDSISMFQLPQYTRFSVSAESSKNSNSKTRVSEKVSVTPSVKLGFSPEVSDKINYKASFTGIIAALPSLLGILALLGSTFLVVSENIIRFQTAGLRMPNLMGWVLEIAIVALSFYGPRIFWSFSTRREISSFLKVSTKLVSAKLVLVALVFFSLSTSVVSDRVAGVEKIASVSAKAGDQSLAKQIGISVAALEDFQRKGESGNIKATQEKLADLRSKQKETLKSDDVKELKSAYLSEQYTNMAAKAVPLLISITFAHLLGAAFRKKKSFITDACRSF